MTVTRGWSPSWGIRDFLPEDALRAASMASFLSFSRRYGSLFIPLEGLKGSFGEASSLGISEDRSTPALLLGASAASSEGAETPRPLPTSSSSTLMASGSRSALLTAFITKVETFSSSRNLISVLVGWTLTSRLSAGTVRNMKTMGYLPSKSLSE